jgi:AcrR family transcriptional regulator
MTDVVICLFSFIRSEVVNIYSKFYSLEPEKQERIINAATREFARNGYEKASTNEIIKEANISKGSLFNYFKSKKELYLYLFEYISRIIDEIYNEIDLSETDFFKRIKTVGLIKFRIMKKYPQAFNFLKTVAHEGAVEVKPEIDKIRQSILKNGFDRIYENIDLTKFREDIDIQRTMNIINWTMLSFSEEQISRLNSFEDIGMEQLNESDAYFDIMKRCFYKEGEG